ncbi:MAG TPA: hypothetical protein VFP98_04110 [Candidatus Polarisedimenticolia bacterium]|nr:hypothetical protein [Candidatus Polarisedimenticolia bacterium]
MSCSRVATCSWEAPDLIARQQLVHLIYLLQVLLGPCLIQVCFARQGGHGERLMRVSPFGHHELVRQSLIEVHHLLLQRADGAPVGDDLLQEGPVRDVLLLLYHRVEHIPLLGIQVLREELAELELTLPQAAWRR